MVILPLSTGIHDRIFSHNPLLFGRHLIDYIVSYTDSWFLHGRMLNVPLQIGSRA